MLRSTLNDRTSVVVRLLIGLCCLAGAWQSARAGADSDLHRPSPDWRDQIIYSLMIDRFDDGDPANNDQGAGEYRPGDDAYFQGGDIRGIIRRIPYLQDLGVTAAWISPPTATQWWDPVTRYSGYHGYWPVHFKQVDAHFGTLADYQALSRRLHANGMYLIQDVVVNQIGHYYNYAGGYDPADKRRNFNLVRGAVPEKPLMYPFSLVNLHDPEAARANVYHWTPSITDYADPAQQYTHQLQLMNDLNTSNPLVRVALKDAYGFWIRAVGVDAFRVDAAKHVEADFLRDFLHGPGGIMEAARSTGRTDFLTFGEIFNFSDPMTMTGEQAISQFMGSAEQPQLGAVINFPLKEELRRVFARGLPSALLGYRLQEQARQFDSSARWPSFVNNHDVQRFLATGSADAYRQAYLLVMTAPGIPVIYQGDEQGLTEVRRALFATPGRRAFDRTSAEFRFLQTVIALRKQHPALRRGALDVLQDNAFAPGVLAFRRTYQGETLYVILNTAGSNTALLNGLPVGPGRLETVFALNLQPPRSLLPDRSGRLTFALPPASALVLRASAAVVAGRPAEQDSAPRAGSITLDRGSDTAALRSGDSLCGQTDRRSRQVQMLINGNLDSALSVPVSRDGRWCARLPAISLDPRQFSAEFHDPATNLATASLAFEGRGAVAFSRYFADPAGDDRGPRGSYRLLTDRPDHRAADIRGVGVRMNDAELELTIDVAEISNVWNYINKFDHAAFSIFIDSDPGRGASALPGLFHTMPQGQRWDLAHRLFGMGSTVFSADGATARAPGRLLAGRPLVQVDHARRQITIRYSRTALGIKSWKSAKIYIASWDADEFGSYRALGSDATAGELGGGLPTDPHILDDISFSLTESETP